MTNVKITAIHRSTGVEEEIEDLYWFEENLVHDFGGDGHAQSYDFIIEIGGRKFKIVKGEVNEEYMSI